MKYIIAMVFLLFPYVTRGSEQFAPPPNSPIAATVHPRIFVTADDIVAMRQRIQTYYKTDFQQFVNSLDGLYGTSAGSGSLADWNDIFGAARSYALLYQVDPKSISGVTSAHTKDQYGRRAIDIGLYIAQRLSGSWSEAHHGADNLTTSDGGLASLALQVVYDWTHDLSTLAERRQMADRLITLWKNRYSSDKVKLENHYAANVHVYSGALCFYGDSDLGSSYTTTAQQMMDSFQDVFVNRQLGVAERVFEGSSDWVEGDSYSMDGYAGIMFLAAAASSAMNVDYFATNSWLHYAPYYMYYNVMPMPYKGEYYFSQQNTSIGMSADNRSTNQMMNLLAAELQASDPQLSSFAAWYCESSRYGMAVNQYNYYEPYLFDFFYKFVFGTKHITKKSPDEAEISLSFKLGQMHVMRSDHGYNDATLIQFFDFQYWYPNGHNEEEMGAINIHRFGTLAVSPTMTKNAGDGIPRVEDHGKGMVQNNVLGVATDNSLSPDMGSISDSEDTPEDYAPGKNTQIGIVEAREYREGVYDYINYNYTRAYKGGNRVGLARRALVYLRGSVNHEFVVLMDRVQSSLEKYFLLHTPVDLVAVDGSWASAGSGKWTSSGKTLRVTNRIDQAHGQMYVTSVLPKNSTIYKIGGPGYEWVYADGTPLSYNKSEFAEIASYLYGDHTLQIRSQEGQYLTVLQIGDANTMGDKAAVESLAGSGWVGALLERERLVIFSDSETSLKNFSYTINSDKVVKHLITEIDKNREFSVKKGSSVVATGTTGGNGAISFSDNPGGAATYSVTLGGFVSAVEDPRGTAVPSSIRLANYPNPFNPSTTISFNLPTTTEATLKIYNLEGKLIATLVAQALAAGPHQVSWNGTNDRGERVASGIYLYRLEAGRQVAQNKLVFEK